MGLLTRNHKKMKVAIRKANFLIFTLYTTQPNTQAVLPYTTVQTWQYNIQLWRWGPPKKVNCFHLSNCKDAQKDLIHPQIQRQDGFALMIHTVKLLKIPLVNVSNVLA